MDAASAYTIAVPSWSRSRHVECIGERVQIRVEHMAVDRQRERGGAVSEDHLHRFR